MQRNNYSYTMSLFQKNVELKYLRQFDSKLLETKYNEFLNHFGNPVIQENIKNCKEEQYQGEFLIDLFVNILGYTKQPAPGFNLTSEYKNIKDSKKADGAIIIENAVKAVIELKGTDTTNLSKVETQAFGYKNNQPDCNYVITSNFEKLRFYIDNAIEFVEFNLFRLSKVDFDLLYLCISFESISKGIPRNIKDESISQEDKVTRQLYSDYSLFKWALFQNLTELNSHFDSLILFKKSQKLLDRFLFLLFAEDRNLLPPNSVRLILSDWRDLKERDVEIPLYDRFKKYFEYLNTGYKGKRYDVFAYNGGLFKPDKVLDNIVIEDELLFKHATKLSEYDFASEVDVNILGHIFENSLNDLDEIKARQEGVVIEKSKTKRKKEGVFYTPKYITKYIIENTVGKLCEDKKNDLQITEGEFTTDKKRSTKVRQQMLDRLQQYRDWLLQLTICDPACGSGAFLNQALEYLINEHQYIDELQAKIYGASLIFSDYEKSILENNLYGVDLNEESVEIAKLSLWLRTAQLNRTLNDLNNNIKCGNSLIDDTAITDKAFNWANEFPHVFAKGGFDVVIGNPPYVQLQSIGEMSDKLKNCGFETFHKGGDIYCLFTERGYRLLRDNGLQSFIMPNKWMVVAYGKPLRDFLLKTGLRQLLNFGDVQFFQEATTYVCILVTQKGKAHEKVKVLALNNKTYHGDFLTEVKANLYDDNTSQFSDKEWIIVPIKENTTLWKMNANGIKLKDLPLSINYGIKTGFNEAFYVNENTRAVLISEDPKSADIIKPMVRGRDVIAFGFSECQYLLNVHNGIKEKSALLAPIDIQNYPAVKNHLDKYLDQLEKRSDKGNTPYNLRNCAYLNEFAKPKIIYPNMTSVFPFMYDESGMLCNQKCFILTAKDKSVSLFAMTAILNSSLAKLWIWYNCPELMGGTREISKIYFENFPVPTANKEEVTILEELAKQRISLTSKFQESVLRMHRIFDRKFNLLELSNKLNDWYMLEFKDFISELGKKKVKLTLNEEGEWEGYFLSEKQKVLEIKVKIEEADREIDEVVGGLYGIKEKHKYV